METPMNALVDIHNVKIDSSLPQKERMKSFVRQIKNPYCFKVGDVTVQVSYTNCGATINDRFAEMLAILK